MKKSNCKKHFICENEFKLNSQIMGTLGCINNMMRRDKENRELRKAGKERLNETRNRLIE